MVKQECCSLSENKIDLHFPGRITGKRYNTQRSEGHFVHRAETSDAGQGVID